MSSGRSEFSIDDAFELSLEEGGPGSGGTTPRFGALHFERKGRGDAEEEGEKQSRLKYQGLWPVLYPKFSVVLQHHQQQYPALLSGLLQLDTAPSDQEESPGGSGLLPTVVTGPHTHPHWNRTPGEPFSSLGPGTVPVRGMESSLSTSLPAGVSSAIFFVPGFLLLIPGVYHVIFIYFAVRGHQGFQFFYLPYFEK
ncbi:transmembrane protein 134 isoform X9 [Notamacropus eugenii]|uniref:transmembrane protein 134 isoform X9 n=1 Tax=Notamacropus eugenii TaxID=9315 RepID=UPI003B68445A